jgi:hypothetical protein
MPPEDELCLLLARGQLSPELRDRGLALLCGPLRWDLLLDRAKGFDLFPLVYAGLRMLGFPAVPDQVRSAWRDIFRSNAIQNELLARELARILRLIGEAGIPAMPLKGITLAESLYGDTALRVCADIDVLVPPSHAVAAFRVVVSSGYRPAFAQPRLLELVARYGKDCMLMTRRDRLRGYLLELHLGLLWGGPLESDLLEEIWSEAVRKTFYGVPAFALSAEWEFLYLAMHASRHGGPSLKWLMDLDRLCHRGAIDWKKVNEKVKLLGWEAPIRSGLAACASLFDTRVDPALGPIPPLSRIPAPSASPAVSEILFSLRALKTPARRLHYLVIHLFIPTLADCQFLPLPASLFFLYYALRPFRVAFRTAWWFGDAAVRKLRGALRRRAPDADRHS